MLTEYINWYESLGDAPFKSNYIDIYTQITILADIENAYREASENPDYSEPEQKTFAQKAENLDNLLQGFYMPFAQRCERLGIKLR